MPPGIPATFNQLNIDTSVTPVYGGLLATSRKILFLSQAGPRQIPLNSITKVSAQAGGVLLELAGNSGHFLYTVQDPAYTEAVIDTIVRVSGQDVSQTQRGAGITGISCKRLKRLYGSATKVNALNAVRLIFWSLTI
jgi:hypothetical protein